MGTTGTTTSSPLSSCPATSWAGCSSAWTSSTRTPSGLPACSEKTTTTASPPSGCSKVTSWHLTLTRTGRRTTPATSGTSWTPPTPRPGRWWSSTGSGKEKIKREESSIKERFLSEISISVIVTGDGFYYLL